MIKVPRSQRQRSQKVPIRVFQRDGLETGKTEEKSRREDGLLREKGAESEGLSGKGSKTGKREARTENGRCQLSERRWGGEGPEERTLRREPRREEATQGTDRLGYSPLIPPH